MGGYVEAVAYLYHFIRDFWADVYFHPVSHVENLVHFLPVSTALLLYNPEEWRYGEHVILDYAAIVVDKVEHFCLGPAGAMYHAVYLRPKLVEHSLDNRGVSAGGG